MKETKRILSLILVCVFLLSAFAGCKSGKSSLEKIEGTLPAATQAEQAVNVTASLAIRYYLAARAYLDRFTDFDTENMDEAQAREFVDTLQNAVATFEATEKLAAGLEEAVDVFEQSTYPEKAKLLPGAARISPLGLTVFAADDDGAKKWAQDIVDAYDAAPTGKGIRTLAEQLGTDSKHAYAQLKQALAVLEGAEYTAIADKANTAVQVATGLKAAGTAAGLVIAVAAAPATTTIGAIAQTGGIVCSGINTVLEVGSAGSIIYNNGEENEFSRACDKTEAQFAPIGQIFSIMGLGAGLKDIGETGKKILEGGYKSLTPKEMNDLGENTFGVLSYVATSINDYVNDGSLLSGTFKKNENGGLDFKLFQTMLGWSDEEVDKFLKDDSDLKSLQGTIDRISAAFSAGGAPVASTEAPSTEASTAMPNEEGTEAPATEPPATPADGSAEGNSIPPEIGDKMIEQKTELTEDDFDIDAYIENLRNLLYEIAAMKDVSETQETASEEETETEEETEAGLAVEDLAGTYELTGVANLTGENVHFENGTQEKDFSSTVIVTAAGENMLHFSVTTESGTLDTDAAFDPETGVSSLSFGALTTGTATFTAENDGIMLHLKLGASGEGYSESISVSGYKQ